jgi:hypothetical protein
MAIEVTALLSRTTGRFLINGASLPLERHFANDHRRLS